MRSPDAALIRARAKSPLPSLQALHLSNSDIECIKHLELCKNLQSLYGDNNHLKEIDGIIELRKLWRIDLSGNMLRDLTALASFRALGFLNLERNQLCFEDLVCLRDQHLLEVRLLGNAGLLKNNTIQEYRKKVVALLSNAWILDDHYISTAERRQAVEESDAFIVDLLNQPQKSISDGKFGSATSVWVDSDSGDATDSAKLIQIANKPSHPSESTDLKRLGAIVSFHNNECAIHNAHCHFSSGKHNSNSRLMPRIWLDDVLALQRRARLEVMVLLSVFLEFEFPKVLLVEALTIRQLSSPDFPHEAIQDTVNLPRYALVALLAIARHYSLEEEQSMVHAQLPEMASAGFADERELLGSIPPLFPTLLDTKSLFANLDAARESEATTRRCRRAIKLLSNVASFPDPEIVAIAGKGKRTAILRELMPLIRAAESANRIQGDCEVVVPGYGIMNRKTLSISASDPLWKPELKDQNRTKQEKAGSPTLSRLNTAGSLGSVTRTTPKPGHWVEVSAKQFVRIQFISDDGQTIVGVVPTDSSRTISIALEQMTRISNSVWRVNNLTRQQREDLYLKVVPNSAVNNTRIGKLHRDSEAFHRHGAARNQGFPNHFVTSPMLEDFNQPPASQYAANAIEVFSSNDTLDANYVLASPQLIAAQNYCAVNAFQQQQGLWSSVQQAAPYSVLQPATLGTSSSLTDLKQWKTPQPKLMDSTALDDWQEIRREMQAQLGIDSPRVSAGSECPVSSPQKTPDPHPSSVVSMELPQPNKHKPRRRSQTFGTDTRGWHAVATKTQFVVAASSALAGSLSAPTLPTAQSRSKAFKSQLPSLCRT